MLRATIDMNNVMDVASNYRYDIDMNVVGVESNYRYE